MENEIFWEVFRDTGDPVCWLLTRIDDPPPAKNEEKPDREDEPSRS